MAKTSRRRTLFALVIAHALAFGCGGDSGPTAPSTSPAAPAPAANQAVNMALLAQLPLAGMSRGATGAAGLWGTTTTSGRRLALVGLTDGTAVVDVTDPARPRTTGLIVGELSSWREIRVYGDYAYVSTEANTGLDIIDLRNPDQPVKVQTWNRTFTSAHSLEIETERGLLLMNGTRNAARADNGLRVLDVATNPREPREVGAFTAFYVHDAYVRGNRIYAAAIRDGFLGVLDVSDPSRITEITRFFTGGRFTHNSWLTGDSRYLFTTDERSGRPLEGWDIANVLAPRKVTEYNARPTGIPHNVVVDGTRLFVAHYGDGVHVLDVANPENPRLIGSYDTFGPPSDGFDGCWGVYPFPGSDLVIASDRQGGLFVLQVTGR